jgi:hypothetical protein
MFILRLKRIKTVAGLIDPARFKQLIKNNEHSSDVRIKYLWYKWSYGGCNDIIIILDALEKDRFITEIMTEYMIILREGEEDNLR